MARKGVLRQEIAFLVFQILYAGERVRYNWLSLLFCGKFVGNRFNIQNGRKSLHMLISIFSVIIELLNFPRRNSHLVFLTETAN